MIRPRTRFKSQPYIKPNAAAFRFAGSPLPQNKCTEARGPHLSLRTFRFRTKERDS